MQEKHSFCQQFAAVDARSRWFYKHSEAQVPQILVFYSVTGYQFNPLALIFLTRIVRFPSLLVEIRLHMDGPAQEYQLPRNTAATPPEPGQLLEPQLAQPHGEWAP